MTFQHGDVVHDVKALFGMRKSDLWIEATLPNVDFVKDAMRDDFNNARFAVTRPRGPCFQRQETALSSEYHEQNTGDGNLVSE